MKFELNEYHRNVSDEVLLADVRRVAEKMSVSTITIEEYEVNGKYHSTTLRRRFGSWRDVLFLAGLEIEGHNFAISDQEYISDIIWVASLLGKSTVTCSEYEEHGNFARGNCSKRFGSWKEALKKAGLESTGYFHKVEDEDLLEDIEEMWIRLGRQPTTNDVRKGCSKFGLTTFCRHFGGWRNALEAFIEYVNCDEEDSESIVVDVEKRNDVNQRTKSHKTRRDISLRLRFLVMKRDSFKCRACGASPATDSSIMLHIDHIVPWSKGGETVFENLQTLCSDCNLGKSDML